MLLSVLNERQLCTLRGPPSLRAVSPPPPRADRGGPRETHLNGEVAGARVACQRRSSPLSSYFRPSLPPSPPRLFAQAEVPRAGAGICHAM
eukprot:496890-Pyramimonas_sp.AAC.2